MIIEEGKQNMGISRCHTRFRHFGSEKLTLQASASDSSRDGFRGGFRASYATRHMDMDMDMDILHRIPQ